MPCVVAKGTKEGGIRTPERAAAGAVAAEAAAVAAEAAAVVAEEAEAVAAEAVVVAAGAVGGSRCGAAAASSAAVRLMRAVSGRLEGRLVPSWLGFRSGIGSGLGVRGLGFGCSVRTAGALLRLLDLVQAHGRRPLLTLAHLAERALRRACWVRVRVRVRVRARARARVKVRIRARARVRARVRVRVKGWSPPARRAARCTGRRAT